MATRYKQAYAKLGEERVQEVDKKKTDSGAEVAYTESDLYWQIRKDSKWTVVPGYRR